MSSEFTFGENSDKSSFFFKFFFVNLVDRDLTEHQITQTLTLSRLDAQLEQTREIRLFTHTQQVDWSRQRESDCLIKQVILRLLSSVQCSAIRANLWSDFMEWIHDEYSVVEKHAQTMPQLVEFGMDWEMWRTGADREHFSYSDCGRDHRVECYSYTDCGRDHRGEFSSSTECGRDRRGEQILDCVEEYPEFLL